MAEIIFEDGLVESSMSSPNLLLEIRDAVQTAHGDYGLACVRSSLKGGTFMIRIRLNIYMYNEISLSNDLFSVIATEVFVNIA